MNKKKKKNENDDDLLLDDLCNIYNIDDNAKPLLKCDATDDGFYNFLNNF
jgi:hypothetical protein